MSSSDENRLGIVKHRDIYDLVQGFIGLLSPDGTVLDANKSALDLIGVQLDDVVGLKFWTTPWWRVCQKSRLALKDAIRRGASGQPSHFEARVGDKNGEIVDINFSLTPIINKAGVVVSLVPEGHDITARKQAKTALQESEARLHLAYDAAEMGTWDWDFAEDYLHWSDRQFELFGMPKKSRHLRLEDALTTVHPDDRERVKTAVAMSAENDLPFREEFRVVHNTGEVRWLVGQGNILHHSESGRPKSLIGVNYDITERKRLEIKLAQSNSELEARVADRSRALEEEMRERQKVEGALAHSQRFELIGQLAGGVAHDFNNFLAVIGGNLELAAMRTADKRIVELINEAMEAVEAGASLNRRLLSFAREHVLEPVALAVNDRITKTRPLLERTLGANIELVTELEPDLWQTTADSGEFDSAILNLALNARDAMASGGKLRISTRNLTLSDQDAKFIPDAHPHEYIEISVSDTGVGMSADVKEKAITPYFTTKEEGKGSGLGLSSVYGFAAQSSGFVRIDSSQGIGTTVAIWLPRASSPATASKVETSVNNLPLGQRELILLVEDDDRLRRITHKRLVELGYEVIEASTATQAIGHLEGNAPVTLVFSDIKMPGGMSGYDLARWVLENRAGTGVLLTSGYNDFAKEGLQDVELLAKPYTLPKLADALRDAVAQVNAP
ncbi:PAS domain-containing protein [Sulfitobacter sp. HGT1]|uniref:PAS domain-containing protein n=1 Tax=Sulfitobacter sp. HGT1 TaxID=2735435 RepID=UPI001592B0D1|nr:PAS domain-containing protein [Sulfitobacter sp. HGT1]